MNKVLPQPSCLIKNGLLVTMNSKMEVLKGDILVSAGRILKIAPKISVDSKIEIVDASNCFVIPGLIQAHTHLCQVLFRGEADDLALLDWLQKKIWPMEAAHNSRSIKASAEIAILEMHLSGTTSILDMGTVKHTNALLEAVSQTGMRYWGGKCLMDEKSRSGPLYEDTKTSIRETDELIKIWQLKSGLIEYALCPRFAVSCTEKILRACGDYQKQFNLLIHTHASESKEEVELIRRLTGKGNIDYFNSLGLLNAKTVIVHGVHVSEKELRSMIQSGTPLVHCPSSNMKLGSGFAPTTKYLKKKLLVGLGSDGAPCNNSMDQFVEMRMAALIQKPFFGPTAMPAQAALKMATINGAKLLGRHKELGSLEPGKLADLVLVDRSHPSVCTVESPYSALVYSCLGRDVTDVMVNGRWVVRAKEHTVLERERVVRVAKAEKRLLLARMA